MAINLFEYQVLYLLLHFLKFLLIYYCNFLVLYFLILHQPVILPQRKQNLCMTSLHICHTNHLRYFTLSHIHLQCSCPTLWPYYSSHFFLLLLLVSFAYTNYSGFGSECFVFLICHYYLFHSMFGVSIYQYCVIRVLLCLITLTSDHCQQKIYYGVI